MNRPVMGPADQGQVPQVSRATVEPVPQMMGLAPGQRPITVREDTAAVPDRQGGALGRGDDPGATPKVQGLAGGATQDRGEQGHGRPQPPLQVLDHAGGVAGVEVAAVVVVVVVVVAAGAVAAGVVVGGGAVAMAGAAAMVGIGVAGWRVTRTRVTVASQASRRHASGSRGSAQPSCPPSPPG
jgi:hypothetical protein